ncbi:ABC transporter ATP-binding protein [Glutamicibacter protophormiae]|uniref:Putative ABC transporter ATP-binding protein n=2 Tax=Kocuria TaxID=57493 RepID=A0A7D7Q3P5_KOCVA|nr:MULTISPECIES: ABC transporter ATP-binding protein [Kocuria]MDN5631246.1 ABC transporter ATP-binding protein [Kocuria sp.]QMS56418.1 putative ABC transporter ATP-binding protein [Kocuria varians]WNB90137.1 ABC transporter ATP-binding protein [Glutamicibacter protophormiae]
MRKSEQRARAEGRASVVPKATVETAIAVEHLSLGVVDGGLILDDVSFRLRPGRILALVGESGSGKTTAALACMNHLRSGLELRGGTVELQEGASRFHRDAVDLLTLSEKQMRQLRGGTIAYVPQDPALSLNGSLRVGEQIAEVLRAHEFGRNARERDARVAEVLSEVGLPSDSAYQRRFPHQLSGGQQQRIGIAMAFACRPAVIILDEPTTGLDVATQDLVLKTIYQLTTKHDVAGLYITHDLAVVAQVANDVAVMLHGQIVEDGPAERVLRHPEHPYTRSLLAAVPDMQGARVMGGGPAVSPLASVRAPWDDGRSAATHFTADDAVSTPRADAPDPAPSGQEAVATSAEAGAAAGLGLADSTGEPTRPEPSGPARGSSVRGTAPGATRAAGGRAVTRERGAGGVVVPGRENEPVVRLRDLRMAYGPAVILDGINLELEAGQTTMLLGESGSGKTTLSRSVAGLNDGYTGDVLLDGEVLAPSTRRRSNEQRRRIQYVFQSPFSSLNPRRSIGDSLQVPLQMGGGMNREQRRAAVADALDAVRLGRSYIDRRPGELSGGERQRAAVARALVNAPSVLVCDEITSALDVSVQASVIELLRELQHERGLAMLFVTHNIALARHISHKLAVLERGKLVDYGPTDTVLRNPRHAYTRSLLEHVPTLEEVG